MNKPTPRKKRQSLVFQAVYRVYPFVTKYIKEHDGEAPALIVVAKRFKKSQEWVRYCYKALIKRKLIKVAYYKQRGLKLRKV